MKIEVTYANEGQATIDLDPSTFRKVTIDPERPLDTRVRVAFKDSQEPLDLFFLKEGAPDPVHSVPSSPMSPCSVQEPNPSFSLAPWTSMPP